MGPQITFDFKPPLAPTKWARKFRFLSTFVLLVGLQISSVFVTPATSDACVRCRQMTTHSTLSSKTYNMINHLKLLYILNPLTNQFPNPKIRRQSNFSIRTLDHMQVNSAYNNSSITLLISLLSQITYLPRIN